MENKLMPNNLSTAIALEWLAAEAAALRVALRAAVDPPSKADHYLSVVVDLLELVGGHYDRLAKENGEEEPDEPPTMHDADALRLVLSLAESHLEDLGDSARPDFLEAVARVREMQAEEQRDKYAQSG